MPSFGLFWRVLPIYCFSPLISTALNSFQFPSLPPCSSSSLHPGTSSCILSCDSLHSFFSHYLLSLASLCLLLSSLLSPASLATSRLLSLLSALDSSGCLWVHNKIFPPNSRSVMAAVSFLHPLPQKKESSCPRVSQTHCFYSSCFLCCETPAPMILSIKPVSMCWFPVSEMATCIC